MSSYICLVYTHSQTHVSKEKFNRIQYGVLIITQLLVCAFPEIGNIYMREPPNNLVIADVILNKIKFAHPLVSK